ncbi:PLP-dependent aminotransferase family protein [Paenibacillus sp. GCM10012307]|uniref:PLP-dependent aminotransferase family protein n=1 Tax=Paenibacillus roseus TaxID=2798579 RepID=A0A934J894_9BACL|nr:PLP-dependent aminotransferase family protein [Paenibacillus roseus]MBJ6362526.1 PLP-dependent aminotransferase family protein [Paenibacillus roseus]
MEIILHAASKEPLFRQISRQIAEKIKNVELQPNEMLPPERKLAGRLGVNRSTIAAAYQELVTSGFVTKLQGSGTRVVGVPNQRQLTYSVNWEQFWNKKSDNPLMNIRKNLFTEASRPDTINLALGELSGDLLEVTRLLQDVHKLEEWSTIGYIGPMQDMKYRVNLASHLQRRHSITATPDQILLTAGAQQALYLLVNCLLRSGDAIAIESPSFAHAQNLYISAGLRVFSIPVDEEGLIPEHVEHLYTRHKIKMVIVNPTLQNPTGTVLSVERRHQLYDICAARRILIVEDDPYSLLYPPSLGQAPLSLKALYPNSELVLYIGTVSKILSPALRSGWLIAAPQVIERLSYHRREIDNGSSSILQGFTQMLLEEDVLESRLDCLQEVLNKRQSLMLKLLELHLSPYVVWQKPVGGFYVWCTFRQPIDLSDFQHQCAVAGVLIMPGNVMHPGKKCFRLAFSRVSEEQLEEGIALIKRVFERMIGRSSLFEGRN